MESRTSEEAISPAARLVLEGEPFDFDNDHFYVDDRYSCGGDIARDVLVIRGFEYMPCSERNVRRAVQVRDVERWIAEDRVAFPFGPPALGLNIAHGWPASDEDTVYYMEEYEPLLRSLYGRDRWHRLIRLVD